MGSVPEAARRPAETLACDEWIAVLRHECHLRKLPATIAAIQASLGKSVDEQNQVIVDVQKQALADFGVADLDRGVQLLHSTLSRYPDRRDEIADAAFYIKYNVCHDGAVQEGDPLPDVSVMRLDGTTCKLASLCAMPRPTALIMGSRT